MSILSKVLGFIVSPSIIVLSSLPALDFVDFEGPWNE